MTIAMLNVRLDKGLKTEGDRVLTQQGVSATEAVRGLYRFMERTREVPDFCKGEMGKLTAEERRQKMRQLVGIAKLKPHEDLKTLKEERLSRFGF